MGRWVLVCFVCGAGVVLLLCGGTVQAQERSDSSQVRHAADTWAARADSLRTRREVAPALRAYREARNRYRKVGAQGRTAAVTGDIGVMHWLRSRYDEALQAFQEALAAARKAGDQAEAADNLTNIGLVHKSQGRYGQALRRYRAALEEYRAQEDRAGTAVVLNNLGEIYTTRGQLRQALPVLRESLRIHRARGDSIGIATNLNNLGFVHRNQGQYAQALENHRGALAISRALGNRYGEANALNNLGRVQIARNREDEALRSYRRALSLNRELDRQGEVARLLNNIGAALETQGQNDEALSRYQKALAINREFGHRSRVAQNLSNIGHIHLEEDRLAAADSLLRASVRITTPLLRSTSGIDRRRFLSQEIGRFHSLVTTRVRRGRPGSALRVLERSRALLPAERLVGEGTRSDSGASPPSVDSLQTVLGPDEAAVLYANASTDRPPVALVVRADSIYAHEARPSLLQRAVDTFDRALLRLERSTALGKIRGGGLQRAQQSGVSSRLDGRDNRLGDLVHLYRHDLAAPSNQQVLSSDRRRRLGQYLHALLLGPLMEGLSDVDELIVVPDGVLGYLPFATLSDWAGTPLIANTQVRYAQSLRTQYALARRNHGTPPQRTGLLAVGGATYASSSETPLSQTRRLPVPDTTTADSGWAVTPSSTDRIHAPLDQKAVPVRRDYRRLGYRADQWAALPGTRREVSRLRQMTGVATTLTGHRASERTLRRWSRSGRLRDFRVLHFATHGLASPTRPSLSALVLSDVTHPPQPPGDSTAPGQVDGYLNAREIPALDLNADFVILSACRSGLGRVYRGSGVLSLAQSFLEAGASATAVSLWAVYDEATNRFMQAVYRRAWDREQTWAEALTKTKRAFAAGKYGDRYQDPRFWAPFVHYGWAGR